jgi:hypothetical protein
MFRCGTCNPIALWTSPSFRSVRLGANSGGPVTVPAKVKWLAAIALQMARNGLPIKDAPRRTGGTLGDEYDFSCCAALENFLVSARSFGQRQLFRNDRAQRSTFQACDEPRVDIRLFGRRDGPKSEAADRTAATHEVARIDRNLPAIADDDNAAIGSQQLYVMSEIQVRHHFENDVHAAAVRGSHDLVEIARFAVIEDLMSAFALCKLEAFLAAGGAEDSQSQRPS